MNKEVEIYGKLRDLNGRVREICEVLRTSCDQLNRINISEHLNSDFLIEELYSKKIGALKFLVKSKRELNDCLEILAKELLDCENKTSI